jgi:hypothetical protein
MVPVPTQEGEDRLPPHRKPAQVEDEVHKIHTEMRRKTNVDKVLPTEGAMRWMGLKKMVR